MNAQQHSTTKPKTTPCTPRTFVYVANADDATISCYQLDTKQANLKLITTIEAKQNVMPLAISPNKKYLYAAIRSELYCVISYLIQADGLLIKQATSLLPTSVPYITTDQKSNFLLTASYHSNLISIHAINPEGIVDKLLATYPTEPHAHSIIVHPNNLFVYVGNLGADKILQYHLNNQTAELTPIDQGYIQTSKGSGPRHLIISPDGKFLYVIHEMDASITCYHINSQTGALTFVETTNDFPAQRYHLVKSKLREAIAPEDYSTTIWAADIKITPNGQFLYTSERTSSTVSAYHVDQNTGKLTYINTFSVEKQPRSIAIDPTGYYLIATGQLDDKVGLYTIDQQTGELLRVSEAPAGKNANWVSVIEM